MKQENKQPKQLPPLMDGDTMILPAATLPPPDGEKWWKWWEERARLILLPRWVAECIRKELVCGQELREGESMKDRVETIMGAKDEMDKWERIIGWDAVIGVDRMDEAQWKKVDLGLWDDWGWVGRFRCPFSNALRQETIPGYGNYCAYMNAETYWARWENEARSTILEYISGAEGMDTRQHAQSLFDESNAYWRESWNNPHWPDPRIIDAVDEFRENLAKIATGTFEKGDRRLLVYLVAGGEHESEVARQQGICEGRELMSYYMAEYEARAFKAEARALDAQANEAKVRQEFDEEKRLRKEAVKKWTEAEEKAKEAREARMEAEKNAVQWKRRVDAALGLRQERNDALRKPGEVAGELYRRLEERLTPEERDLRDWLMAGKSQNSWGAERTKKDLPGSKAFVSGLRANIERKYREAGYTSPPFPRCRGGRPPAAVGTAEDAELRGLLAGRTRTPTRRQTDS